MTEQFEQVLPEDVQQEEMMQEMIDVAEPAEELEPEMVVIPLRGMVVFPNTETPLDLGRKFSIAAVQEGTRENREVLLAFQKSAEADMPSADELYAYGVAAKIKRTITLPTEGILISKILKSIFLIAVIKKSTIFR